MIILVDSREKQFQDVTTRTKLMHRGIKEYFDRHSIQYSIVPLDVGDYMIDGILNVSVDHKKDLNEVATNLCTNDSSRFWKEIRRSKDNGIKLFVLIEHGGQIHSIKDVVNWNSKYSRIRGRQLAEEMYRVHIAYGVEFLFCDKRSTGKRIVEILNDYIIKE